MAQQRDIRGADRAESRVAAFEMSGKKYLLFLDVACYNDRWFLLNLSGNIGILAGIDSSYGGMVPIPDEAWDGDLEELMVPFS